VKKELQWSYSITTHILYSPYNVNGVACFYHETRLLLADGFSRVGIKPFKIDTEFSLSPAFYATNSVTTAFEFPLHNRLILYGTIVQHTCMQLTMVEIVWHPWRTCCVHLNQCWCQSSLIKFVQLWMHFATPF
jgi:hypothetical protein